MHPPSRPLPQPPSTHQTDPQRSQQRPSYPRQYSTWSGRNSSPPESAVASELVWPLESLSLENSPNSSRRPTPAPRSPTLRTKKARMSDHEGDYFSSPRRTALGKHFFSLPPIRHIPFIFIHLLVVADAHGCRKGRMSYGEDKAIGIAREAWTIGGTGRMTCPSMSTVHSVLSAPQLMFGFLPRAAWSVYADPRRSGDPLGIRRPVAGG